MNREPTRVLAEGTLRYWGARDGGFTVDLMTARVFVIDYTPAWGGGNTAMCTVVAREPMYLPHHRIPSPVGSIQSMPAWVEEDGDLLTLDVEALVPA